MYSEEMLQKRHALRSDARVVSAVRQESSIVFECVTAQMPGWCPPSGKGLLLCLSVLQSTVSRHGRLMGAWDLSGGDLGVGMGRLMGAWDLLSYSQSTSNIFSARS